MKEFPGLDSVSSSSGEVVSFARFIIMSYIFCAEQIPDLIFNFITILKRKLIINTNIRLQIYNVNLLLKLMLEDISQECIASKILLNSLNNIEKENDFNIITIIKLGLKYPILFYTLIRFRKHMKRIIFGDKFWLNKSNMKLKLLEIDNNSVLYSKFYETEKIAIKETSKSIISDIIFIKNNKKKSKNYILNDKERIEIDTLNQYELIKLKNIFGYEYTRQLVIDSEIIVEGDSKFIHTAFGINAILPKPDRGLNVFTEGKSMGILRIPDDTEEEEEEEGSDRGSEQGSANGRDGEEQGSDRGSAADEDGEEQGSAKEKEGSVSEQQQQYKNKGIIKERNASHSQDEEELPITTTIENNISPITSNAVITTAITTINTITKDNLPKVHTDNVPVVYTSKVETILDPQMGREFRFDPETGKSAWVRCVVDEDGDLVLESCS